MLSKRLVCSSCKKSCPTIEFWGTQLNRSMSFLFDSFCESSRPPTHLQTNTQRGGSYHLLLCSSRAMASFRACVDLQLNEAWQCGAKHPRSSRHQENPPQAICEFNTFGIPMLTPGPIQVVETVGDVLRITRRLSNEVGTVGPFCRRKALSLRVFALSLFFFLSLSLSISLSQTSHLLALQVRRRLQENLAQELERLGQDESVRK